MLSLEAHLAGSLASWALARSALEGGSPYSRQSSERGGFPPDSLRPLALAWVGTMDGTSLTAPTGPLGVASQPSAAHERECLSNKPQHALPGVHPAAGQARAHRSLGHSRSQRPQTGWGTRSRT